MPAPQPAPTTEEKIEVSLEHARAIAQALNQRVDFDKFRAEVSVDDATNTFVFRIHTREGGKLIRQIPPNGILLLARRLQAAGPNGLLLDEQV